MAKLFLLLILQVIVLHVALAKYTTRQKFLDEEARLYFDNLAETLDERDILTTVQFRNERRVPRLDMKKYFQRLNEFVGGQSALSEGSEPEENSEYHQMKEDAEKITNLAMKDENPVPKYASKLFEKLMNENVMEKAFSLTGKENQEAVCPVGTIYTYLMSGKLKKCFDWDIKKIALRLMKYKLTSPLENPPEFPTETNNLIEAIAAPVLNQKSSLVVVNSLINGLKDYNIKTPLKLTWPFLWLGNSIRNKQLATSYLIPGSQPNLTTYNGYADFFDEYRGKQRNSLFGIFPTKDFIHYPLAEDPTFDDITRDNKWQSDDLFTQQRLAGLNPMSLRKLSEDDSIFAFFNRGFDWDNAMRNVSGGSFNETVRSGSVFVLDYPLLKGLTNMENIEANAPHHRPLREAVSPITVFASVSRNHEKNTLKPVAIQMDMSSDAAVFTPNDGGKWLMAKEEVQLADIVYVEIIEHLLKTHLLMEPICVIMYRTFSKLHPLYQLFNPHCKYLSVTNSVGVPALFDEHQYLYILFAIGNTGSINLLNKGYKSLTWEDTNFKENLEKRGVMNDNGTLPYFPYRDDGLLLWDKIGKFAEEYVKLYYPTGIKVDISVKVSIFTILKLKAPASIVTDIELQSFATQLSSEKIGFIAGGRFKGFPKTITTLDQLIDVVKRILFIPVQHSAINYPLSYYGAFTPNMPTKLYDPNSQDFTIANLPYYDIVSQQLSIAMTLASIRYDKIFDYSDTMEDERAKKLVKKYYDELHGEVNNLIFERNCARNLDGNFVYPYFMPQWLTNSIQT